MLMYTMTNSLKIDIMIKDMRVFSKSRPFLTTGKTSKLAANPSQQNDPYKKVDFIVFVFTKLQRTYIHFFLIFICRQFSDLSLSRGPNLDTWRKSRQEIWRL